MSEQHPTTEEQPQESQPSPQPVSPRRRLQTLLAIPDSQRTEEQWEEINELEISLAPGNRADGPGQPPQRFNDAPAGKPRSGGGGGGHSRSGGHHRAGGNPGGGMSGNGNPGNSNPGGGSKNKKPFRKPRKKPSTPDAT